MKTSTIIWTIIGLIIIVAAVLFFDMKTAVAPEITSPRQNASTSANVAGSNSSADYKNATYTIEGQPITLMNGRAEAAPTANSASKTITQYFGDEASGDLNGDGHADVAFILTQTGGGSGTYYYIVASLKTGDTYKGTNGILLGDRIAPQSTQIKNGQIVVNYTDRASSDPMTAPPSVGVTKYFDIQNSTLEIAQPIAGEGEHCGGNLANAPVCAGGYHCAVAPGSHLPFGDVGGTCIAD